MKMCIQADLDNAEALRHMNKNNSERPVCITHSLAPISTSFLFVFDTEWVTGPRYRAVDWSKDTLGPSLGLHLLQPSMEGDKKLCKASIDAQALGPAASTLAQPIGMD
jgi:hypothetical protein